MNKISESSDGAGDHVESIRPAHFSYNTPDMTVLRQGDLLHPSRELVSVLKEWHPYFAKSQYKYFLVLTPSCSLAKRDGKLPASHITIAAVRSIDEAVRREAKYYQQWWMEESGSISDRDYNRLFATLERLVDNSEPGYFFLPEEISLGISGHHCAFLRVSIALKSEHYKTCLDAKKAQLEDSFQAKLGWNVGLLYSQVGTTEWDTEYGDGTRKELVKSLLAGSVKIFSAEKISVVLKDLTADDRALSEYSPTEIVAAVERKKIRPRVTVFSEAANDAAVRADIFRRLTSKLEFYIGQNPPCHARILRSIQECVPLLPAGFDAEPLATVVARLFGEFVSDEEFQGRDDVIKFLVASIASDPIVKGLLK